MNFPALSLLLVLFVASTSSVHAFAPSTRVAPAATRPILGPKNKQKPLVAPLWYRVLDQQDDEKDPAALKLMSRAPPGFKMRQALQESSSVQLQQQQQQLQQQQRKAPLGFRSAINKPLVTALRANQYAILALATVISAVILLVTQGPGVLSIPHLVEIFKWTGPNGSGLWDFKLSAENLLLGIGGAMPLLALSNWIESSDKRTFANLNFSTIILCMSLFGRRTVPPDDFLPPPFRDGAVTFPTTKSWQAFVESFSLSAVTGFCEEAVFRRQVPAVLAQLFGGGNLLIPFVGQALLFGLGHAQPSQKLSENAIMVALQTINGLGLGLLLLLSGGNLVVPMIAHATYDFVTFFKTWNDANLQLEYAETKYAESLPPDVERQVQAVLMSNPKMKDPLFLNMLKRLFYTFDFDKNGSLNLSEVKKGLSYFALEKHLKLPSDDEIERLFRETLQSRKKMDGVSRSRLTLPDFLRLYSIMVGGGGLKQWKNPIERITRKVKQAEKELVGV